MKKFLLYLFLLLPGLAIGQDTFSLVAYDETTQELVSAGASCIDRNQIAGGASIISSVHPGHGVIHTQSIWEHRNQVLADSLLLLGLSAKPLLQQLLAQDVGDVPAFRQYAIITIDPISKAVAQAIHTGESCFPWAGHYEGTHLVIAGNILKDSSVIRNMREAFEGARDNGSSLDDAAMASMQAVAYAGADRRCTSAGISSRSAFLRLARAGDSRDELTLDLIIDSAPTGVDPIDLLAERYALQQGR